MFSSLWISLLVLGSRFLISIFASLYFLISLSFSFPSSLYFLSSPLTSSLTLVYYFLFSYFSLLLLFFFLLFLSLSLYFLSSPSLLLFSSLLYFCLGLKQTVFRNLLVPFSKAIMGQLRISLAERLYLFKTLAVVED